jgi:hypothetical protein
LVKCAGALVALAVASGCTGASPGAPPADGGGAGYSYVGRTLAINGRLVTAARPPSARPRFETILPELRRSARKKFEYVFSYYGTYASIFDYPTSTQQIGSIPGDGGQGCTNRLYGYGRGIMWNVGGQTQITEYKVLSTPIKTLSVPYSFPSSCAMDTSGDLAVGILYASGVGGGDMVIFPHASGTPIVYTTPLDEEFFDGYDPQGDLFADGFTGDRSGFALVELAKGAKKFKTIATSNSPVFPGSVQWDGTYLTVYDQIAGEFYQYSVSGTTATLQGTIALKGAGDCAQTWIVKGLVYCGDAGNNDGSVYKYPAGGSPIATLTGNFDTPLGIVAAQR